MFVINNISSKPIFVGALIELISFLSNAGKLSKPFSITSVMIKVNAVILALAPASPGAVPKYCVVTTGDCCDVYAVPVSYTHLTLPTIE